MRWKPWLFWPVLFAVVAAVALVGVCRYFRVYSWGGWKAYQAMEHERHPAWRDYHFSRVAAGDAVEDVIARTNPVRVTRDDRWVFLDYDERQPGLAFGGMTAAAYDGRMVFAYAWSCTWTRLFFDELSEEQSLQIFGRAKDDPHRLGVV